MTVPNCNDRRRQRRPAGSLLMKTLEYQSGPTTVKDAQPMEEARLELHGIGCHLCMDITAEKPKPLST